MITNVGELKKELSKYPDDMEISFGYSESSKSPYIFYRTKQRGPDLLQVELNEYNKDTHNPESVNRITISELSSRIEFWDDSVEIAFGSGLKLNSIKPVLTLNFSQE